MKNDPNQHQPAPDEQQQPPWDQQPPSQYGQLQQPPLYESQPQWRQQFPPQYGQPPYGILPVPSYWPPQQPKKPSRRWLWITLAILGGIIALSCVSCTLVFALGFSSFASLVGPDFGVQEYYQAIEHQDYPKAYTYLDGNATLTVNGQSVPVTNPDLFAAGATTLDNTLGPVSYFRPSINPNDYSRIDVTVTRNGPSYLIHLQLAQVGSIWKIISADGI
jgi:hypothetical protein